MPIVRRVTPDDLFKLNLCNLDHLTENYDLNFYMTYLMKWPAMFQCVVEHGKIVGYIMGKVEESPPRLRVAPQYRRLGYASLLTESLEKACDKRDAWFMDLYVRESNEMAIGMYKKMGYSVFRRVVEYYSDDPTGRNGGKGEDAFDMRKSLSRDKDRKHVRENGEEHRVTAEDVF
jgi:N-terminal acetyltransferase B complex catalytic subunit